MHFVLSFPFYPLRQSLIVVTQVARCTTTMSVNRILKKVLCISILLQLLFLLPLNRWWYTGRIICFVNSSSSYTPCQIECTALIMSEMALRQSIVIIHWNIFKTLQQLQFVDIRTVSCFCTIFRWARDRWIVHCSGIRHPF